MYFVTQTFSEAQPVLTYKSHSLFFLLKKCFNKVTNMNISFLAPMQIQICLLSNDLLTVVKVDLSPC